MASILSREANPGNLPPVMGTKTIPIPVARANPGRPEKQIAVQAESDYSVGVPQQCRFVRFPMISRMLRRSGAAFVLFFAGAALLHGQGIMEYGITTANSGAIASAVKPTIPTITIPGAAPSGGAGARVSSTTSNAPTITPEAAAKANREFLQSHAGASPAQISVHTAPVAAQAWIDGRFVGPTPLDLKLAPGHHRVLVRAPNMQESTQEIDLAAKQALPIDLPLKAATQSTVVLHWPSQKQAQ